MSRLNLSPEQRAQIVAIRRQSEDEGRLLVQRLRQARRALDAAIYADTIDERMIEEGTRDVAAAQAALVRLRAATELKLRRVLAPEQLGILQDLRQQAVTKRRFRRRLNQTPNDDGANGAPQTRLRDALNRRLRQRRQQKGDDPQ